ncbi:hypothetical protein [Mangrovibrevibacter kandeliae]|uniref:hypothetical protein n=1 Tax=Mangrovibrevibacter kandeliae TaxID=2968473 RepID=UPI0021182177|nr:hypothetical protein [Aurantimonas sp. CSK15Z-1]MCQ8780842.1 hypothetical protein [Aurantimonas sp. CSK15Z-1]
MKPACSPAGSVCVDKSNGIVMGSIRRISWGAILAGALLILMLHAMASLLGLGLGLQSGGSAASDVRAAGLRMLASPAGLWSLGSILVSTLIGAYAAGRFAGFASRRDGLLHGLVAWIVATLVLLAVLGDGRAVLLGEPLGDLAAGIEALRRSSPDGDPTTAIPSAAGDAYTNLFQPVAAIPLPAPAPDPTAPREADTAAPLDADARREVVLAGIASEADAQTRHAAVVAVADAAGIPQADASARLEAFASRLQAVRRQAEEAEARTARRMSRAALAAFVVLLAGLIAGAVGGLLGAPRKLVTAQG